MILFYGDDKPKQVWIDGNLETINENAIRAAKLRALQRLFTNRFGSLEDDSTTHPMNMAKDGNFQRLKGNKKRLILNSHGNTKYFGAAGKDGSVVAQELIDAGIDTNTEEIWVCACLTGMQRQDNKPIAPAFGNIINNFGRKFERALKNHFHHSFKVYVPRGWISYRGIHWKEISASEKTIVIDQVVVTTQWWCDYGQGPKEAHGDDKKTYNFFEGGMLLVML